MNKMYRSLSAGLLTFVLLSPKLYATNPALEEAAYILALEEQMKTGRSIPESEYSKHKKWLFDESMRTTVFFLQGLSDTSSKEEKLKKIKEYKSRTAYTFESRKQQVRTILNNSTGILQQVITKARKMSCLCIKRCRKVQHFVPTEQMSL